MEELRTRIEKIKVQYHYYQHAQGEPLTEKQQRHNLMNILPGELLQQLQVQDGFKDCNYDQIMIKVQQIINTQVQYGIDNAQNHKVGLMKMELEEKEELLIFFINPFHTFFLVIYLI